MLIISPLRRKRKKMTDIDVYLENPDMITVINGFLARKKIKERELLTVYDKAGAKKIIITNKYIIIALWQFITYLETLPVERTDLYLKDFQTIEEEDLDKLCDIFLEILILERAQSSLMEICAYTIFKSKSILKHYGFNIDKEILYLARK